jgi:hypothetical protein
MLKVKSVFLASAGNIRVEDVDYPVKKADEALIKVESLGICGSDIGAYRGINPLVSYPRIIGHEVAGTVIEGGEGLPENIKPGDRVIVDPYIYCGHCYPCRIGRTNCCEHLQVIGVHIDGGMREIFAHPANLLHKVPDNIPLAAIPLAEPLTIALHALHRTTLIAGEHIVIIGAGTIGLLAALVALHYKAIPILIDIVPERLDYARSLGIENIINPAASDAIAIIKRLTQGRMAEVVVEASGANAAIKNTLDYVSFAGRIAFTGWPNAETLLPTNIITLKEVDIRGSRTSKGEFPEALMLLAKGIIPADKIISKTLSLEEIPAAVKDLSANPGRYLKINALI